MFPDKTEITYLEFCWLLYLIFIQGEDTDKLYVAKEALNKAAEYEKNGLDNPVFREWIKEWVLED